jgi:hypothetical protein
VTIFFSATGCTTSGGPGRTAGCRLAEVGAVGVDRLFDRLAQVLPQVEAVGDLYGARRAVAGAFAITARAVPADHRHLGMRAQPRGQVRAVAAVEELDRAVAGHVDQHGAVVTAFAEGEVAGTGHRHRPAAVEVIVVAVLHLEAFEAGLPGLNALQVAEVFESFNTGTEMITISVSLPAAAAKACMVPGGTMIRSPWCAVTTCSPASRSAVSEMMWNRSLDRVWWCGAAPVAPRSRVICWLLSTPPVALASA